jgi:SAM-dependent methyltransferase
MIHALQGLPVFRRTCMKHYPSQYAGPDTGPGRCLKLLEEAAPSAGLVLDIGCGRAPIAERLRDLGLEYVGIDVDADALEEVRSRGFEAHRVDLTAGREELAEGFQRIVADRPIAAALAIDVLEHLIEPAWVLSALRVLPAEPPWSLIVSVPNLTHFDVAAKLLIGRWDLTEFGLLDDTHLRFFSERLFSDLFDASGWQEVAADDVVGPISDQHFPADAPYLHPGAPGRGVLHRLSARAQANYATYQFIRRFLPSDSPAREHSWAIEPAAEETDVFATVLVRAGDENATSRVLAELNAQSSRDFETILLSSPGDAAPPGRPGLRVLESSPEGAWNAGIEAARGRLLCFVDETARVSTDWIESFQAAEMTGQLLATQVTAVPAGRLEDGQPDELVTSGKPFPINSLDLLHPNRPKPTVLSAYAVPRAVATEGGIWFEAKYGRAAPAVFLSQAAEVSGVVPLPAATVVVASDASRDGEAELAAMVAAFDEATLILPPGSASRILELQRFNWRWTLPRRAIQRILAATRRSGQ